MITIKEIAKICEVSVATVSNIINDKGGVSDETRARVMKVIQEMNYTPNSVAKNLKTKNSRSIGVIAEDMTVFALPDIIDGITEYCEKEDYQILLVNLRLYKKFEDTYYRDNSYKAIVHKEIRKLLSKQVEGIIYVAAHERLINVIPEGMAIPTVVAYGFTNRPEIPSVVVADTKGAMQLVTYLISRGHRKIGVIAGKKDSLHTQSRLEGYQRALFEGGILYDPNLVVYGEWDRASGYRNTDVLVEKNVTAIFCMNDFMAGGAYDRLDELGYKIGKDMAVAGFDNREMAEFEKPPLTTMGLPLHDMGYCASELIIKLVENEKMDTGNGIYYVDCNFFDRESVNQVENNKTHRSAEKDENS
ncbi:MAG: LacI family DNA-binding transcriptional regulator [Eubacteriales bacterium]|nr:LacI family DNA-binding transcriptional regulator [Eubacteriales bacterium]